MEESDDNPGILCSGLEVNQPRGVNDYPII